MGSEKKKGREGRRREEEEGGVPANFVIALLARSSACLASRSGSIKSKSKRRGGEGERGREGEGYGSNSDPQLDVSESVFARVSDFLPRFCFDSCKHLFE